MESAGAQFPGAQLAGTQFAGAQFAGALDAVLRREIPDCAGLADIERLSGGASMETYRLTCRRSPGPSDGRPDSRTDSQTGSRTDSQTGSSANAAGSRSDSQPGATFDLCLRRGPDGAEREGENVTGIAAEARCMAAAHAAGVPEPKVLYVMVPDDGVGAGFIMEWLEGETLGARIARSPQMAPARERLAFACGQEMARIHSIDVAQTGLDRLLRRVPPAEYLEQTWDRYRQMPTPQPMIDYAARWLAEQLSGQPAEQPEAQHGEQPGDQHREQPPVELKLVHNDFRNGNIMVDPERGLIGVLDWETAHIGDPMRDLGWICTNSWRFGQRHLPVGGFGQREDLFAGYESVAGEPVDPARVQYWEVFGSFWWAVGCLSMAERYRQGVDATVERPGIGRRSSECQLDCVNLIIPGRVSFVPAVSELGLLAPADLPNSADRPSTTARAAHAAADMPNSDRTSADRPSAGLPSSDMPSVDELLSSVRDFLAQEVRPATHGRLSFLALVAANSVDIALRERVIAPQLHRYELAALAKLLDDLLDGPPCDPDRSDAAIAAELTALRWQLVYRLRDGSMPLDAPGLAEYLRTSVAHQVAIDQPRYSAFGHIAQISHS